MPWHKVLPDAALWVVQSLAVPLVAGAARLLGPLRVPSSERIVTGIGVAIITGVMVAVGSAPADDRTRCLLATAGKATPRRRRALEISNSEEYRAVDPCGQEALS
jgi:hypothetical protein